MIRNSFIILLLAASLTGCTYPDFKNPLVHPEKAVAFPELAGAYTSTHPKTKEQTWLHIGPAGEKFPTGFSKLIWVVPSPERGLESSEFVCFFEKTGGSYILHIPMIKGGHFDSQFDQFAMGWDGSKIKSYIILKLAKTPTGMNVHPLNEDFIIAKIESSELAGSIEQNVDKTTDPPTIGRREISVDATTEQLRAFFTSVPLNKLFGPTTFAFEKHQ